jgi:tripartite ATP-independent transporter DctM subunit
LLIDALPFMMLGSLVVLLFSGLPVAVVLAGIGVLFCFIGVAIGEMPFIAMYNIPPKFISAMGSSLFYPAVAMLLLMGVCLEKAGIADDMLRCLRLLLRRVPGGLVIAVLLIGVILAPAAGIVGASVVTLTLIALPSMLRSGYRASTATGAIAAAGTVGIILPPAVMLFFLAGIYQVPLGSMFMATVVPGAVLFAAYVLYYLCTARVDTASDEEPNPEHLWQWILLLLRGLIMPVGLIALVLGSIIAGWATPSQSGAIGAAGGLLLVLLNGRLSWSLIKDLVTTTSHLCAMVFFIIMAAAVFSYPFRYFGGDTAIADALQSLELTSWSMLLLIFAIIFVLGFFIDWIEITVITLPVMYPVLVELDFASHLAEGKTTMLWIAAITALVLQTSFITPPFGFALFFLKGSAPPGVTLMQIYRGIVPILVIQLTVIALVFAYPTLVTWLPEQIYGVLR